MKRTKNKYLGDKIYDWRKQNNISQEDFAELVGVTRQTVVKWEAGLVFPKSDKLQQISEIIGIGLEELVLASNNQVSIEAAADEVVQESKIAGKSKGKKFKLSPKVKIAIATTIIVLVLVIGIILIVYANISSSREKDGMVDSVGSDTWNFSIENIGWFVFGVSITVGVILGVILICKAIK